MSAFVLPAELPAHKISCCVYCSLNKSPHLFSTISTRYIPLFHYSVLYPQLCWAFSPYYTLQVHIFLYSTYSLLHTIKTKTCVSIVLSVFSECNEPQFSVIFLFWVLIVLLQGVPTQTCILHFALAGRNMQASFDLKVVWESWVVEFLLMTL